MTTCHYCNQPAEPVTGKEIYPRLQHLWQKHFWRCLPCEAYVGCHEPNKGYGDGTRPLGILANATLRQLKMRVHEAFDPLWMAKAKMNRRQAYKWLAEQMGIPVYECHIGMFTPAQCFQAIRIIEERYRD
jgi:hypothetical protein